MSFYIEISQQILNKYPGAQLGYLKITNLKNISHAFDFKAFFEALSKRVNEKFTKEGITIQNMVEHPRFKEWRKIYLDCGVNPKTFKSSVESLARRFIKDGYKPISNIVDVYNYYSLITLLPMGTYDFDKLAGCLKLTYPSNGEEFVTLNNESIKVKDEVVYEDNSGLVCWMWNHKDSKRTRLTEETENALLVIDSVNTDLKELETVLKELTLTFSILGAKVTESGKLCMSNPRQEVHIQF